MCANVFVYVCSLAIFSFLHISPHRCVTQSTYVYIRCTHTQKLAYIALHRPYSARERESSAYISTLYNINIIQFERSEIFGARIFSTQTTIQFNLSSELFVVENHCKANASCLCPFSCEGACIRFSSRQIVRIT